MSTPTLDAVLADIASLDDPKIRAVNERHGDDHGVNLSKLRALAKQIKVQPELARELWDTGDSAARLLSILICRPKEFSQSDLDTMLRQARTPKVQDWLIAYVVKKNPHADALREIWFHDPDPDIAAAGWTLTTAMVRTRANEIDPVELLRTIEKHMQDAPERLQWAMNFCLIEIGTWLPPFRQRAIAIGEKLGVLKDYPTPPNCTSPYAPIAIAELVRRQEQQG